MLYWLTRRGRHPRALIIAAAFSAVALLAGCGDGAKKIVGDRDEPDPVINVPSAIAIVSVVLSADLVEVCYDATDANGDLIRIIPEYSTNGGVSYAPATEAPVFPSEGTVGLTSGPAPGLLHCYVWNPGLDGVGISAPATVVFRITPNDGFVVGMPGASDPFDIFNPAVIINVGTTTALFGSLNNQVPLDLLANGTSPVSISVQISYDDTLLTPSTVPAVVGPQGTLANAVIASIDTSIDNRIDLTIAGPGVMMDGVIAYLQFDAAVSASVTPISTPLDCLGVQATDVSLAALPAACGLDGEIFLSPNLPPSCNITDPMGGEIFSPATMFTGDVQIDYVMFDAEGDTVDVTVEYSTDAGGSFNPASEVAGPPSEGTVGLIATPGGAPHIFVWDADLDIPTLTTANEQVVIRIFGTDISPGTPCLSGSFEIDLRNAPPTCAPDPLATAGASGNITLTFDIDDVELDLVDIVFEYSDGGPFLPATASGTSPLPSPALGVVTPAPGLVFEWDSGTDLGPVMAVVTFRLTPGDAFNPVIPAFGPLVTSCESLAFPIDNTARVFQSLVVLGPGSALGAGPNVVGGGYTPGDPCSVDLVGADFTFSQGVNGGELTAGIEFLGGNSPLVFDRDGQMEQLVVQGNFAGLGAPLSDIAMATTADGDTTYALNTAGAGGPYTNVDANGMVTSLLVGANGQSGCDLWDVTFTPNGMGTMGGSNGAPDTYTFAACIDYYGWDQGSRDIAGLLAEGDWDGNVFGTPSGVMPPGAGGSAEVMFVGKNRPMQDPSAFQLTITYDPTALAPNTMFGSMGASVCPGPPIYSSWTAISNPALAPNMWLVNGFRVLTPMMLPTATTESICAMSFSHVGSGPTTIETLVEFWSDAATTDIPGSFPYPYISPACSGGFTVP